jgi:hypothetical protein
MSCSSKPRQHCQQPEKVVLGGTSCGIAMEDEKGKDVLNLLVGL